MHRGLAEKRIEIVGCYTAVTCGKQNNLITFVPL